jgi:hypothetical protein
MRRTRRPLRLAAIIIGIISGGCESDQRLMDLSRESLNRQAEQNEQIARQGQAVTDTTQQLIKAESAVQSEATVLEQQLHAERSALDRQREGLENERRELADDRRRDPMIAESIKGLTVLVAAALPLVICWYLARSLFLSAGEDATAVEVLIDQLATRKPLLSDCASVALPSPVRGDRSMASLAPRCPCLGYRGEPEVDSACSPHRLVLVVEDAHAVEFLKRISHVLAQLDSSVPDLGQWSLDGTVAFLVDDAVSTPPPARNSLLEGPWEFHLLTRAIEPVTMRRQTLAQALNARPNCLAQVTSKRSLENYVHPDAICQARQVRIAFGDFDDVAEIAAKATFQAEDCRSWTSLSTRDRKRLRGRAKKWLNRAAVDQMTTSLLAERDPGEEVVGWLRGIARLANAEPKNAS